MWAGREDHECNGGVGREENECSGEIERVEHEIRKNRRSKQSKKLEEKNMNAMEENRRTCMQEWSGDVVEMQRTNIELHFKSF